ncbi:MAG TPA: hypothetical protein VFG89_04305 [Coriobacteriia bacterium]|nr:hypothetical protein [Coriobacteriia bacterium]
MDEDFARPRRFATRLAALGCALFAAAVLSGCAGVPSPGSAGNVGAAPSAESTVASGPSTIDTAEQKALDLVTSADAYDSAMNARVVSDMKQRLQYDRGATLTAAIRIDRNGAPVDLYFLRRTGELRSVVFGTKDGKLLQVYDKFAVADGDAALSLVDQLAAKLPVQP